MEPNTSLTQMYDMIKGNVATPVTIPVGVKNHNMLWRNKCAGNCEELKNKCAKHIILDIYCKVIPADKEYVTGNLGTMKSDIDNMLAVKGMTPIEYLKSCKEATKNPVLEYVLKSIDQIGKSYMEEKDEELKNANENDIELPNPTTPEPEEDKNISDQLVDVTNDMEYDTFVDALKKKTIDKIVNDVTDIINSSKEDKNMQFDTTSEPAASDDMGGMEEPPATEVPTDDVPLDDIKEERTVITCLNQLQKAAWGKEITEEAFENMLIYAIREATLREMDNTFKQSDRYNEFATRIRLGKGYVITEAVFNEIK